MRSTYSVFETLLAKIISHRAFSRKNTAIYIMFFLTRVINNNNWGSEHKSRWDQNWVVVGFLAGFWVCALQKKKYGIFFESIFLRGRCSLKVFVGRVFITIHLHSGNMTLLRTGCLIDLDKSLKKNIYTF